MRISVDTGRCVGSGMCVLTVDEVFDQRPEDGTAIVLHSEPPADTQDAVRRAVDLCPAEAIVVSTDPDPDDSGAESRSLLR